MILSQSIKGFVRYATCLETAFPSMKFNNILRKKELFKPNKIQTKNITFWEPNARGTSRLPEPIDHTPREVVEIGYKTFKRECGKFATEVKEKFMQDQKMFSHGDTDVIFRFENEESLDVWRLGSDKLNKQGNSDCNLIVNNQKKGVFYGHIDTTIPKDGKAKAAGYCSIRSKKLMKSFFRQDHYKWYGMTHLEIRLRGDGRTYSIDLGMGYYVDVMWLDVYSFYLFTRGGPYWETIRIPFSKFFHTSKGRLQDKQSAVEKERVDSIGISIAAIPGPFKLEIDYIGVYRDDNETEEFAYELYKYPEYIVSLS